MAKNVWQKVKSVFQKEKSDQKRTFDESIAALAKDPAAFDVNEALAICRENDIDPDELQGLVSKERERIALRDVYARLPEWESRFSTACAGIEAEGKRLEEAIIREKRLSWERVAKMVSERDLSQMELANCRTAGVKLVQGDERRNEVMSQQGNLRPVVERLNQAISDERRALAGVRSCERSLLPIRKQADLEIEQSKLFKAGGKMTERTAKALDEIEGKLAIQKGNLVVARRNRAEAQREIDSSRAEILKFEREAVTGGTAA